MDLNLEWLYGACVSILFLLLLLRLSSLLACWSVEFAIKSWLAEKECSLRLNIKGPDELRHFDNRYSRWWMTAQLHFWLLVHLEDSLSGRSSKPPAPKHWTHFPNRITETSAVLLLMGPNQIPPPLQFFSNENWISFFFSMFMLSFVNLTRSGPWGTRGELTHSLMKYLQIIPTVKYLCPMT